MTCVMCGRETSLATAYMLPFLTYDKSGTLKQLAACGVECRDEWWAAKEQVARIKEEYDAQHANRSLANAGQSD